LHQLRSRVSARRRLSEAARARGFDELLTECVPRARAGPIPETRRIGEFECTLWQLCSLILKVFTHACRASTVGGRSGMRAYTTALAPWSRTHRAIYGSISLRSTSRGGVESIIGQATMGAVSRLHSQ